MIEYLVTINFEFSNLLPKHACWLRLNDTIVVIVFEHVFTGDLICILCAFEVHLKNY